MRPDYLLPIVGFKSFKHKNTQKRKHSQHRVLLLVSFHLLQNVNPTRDSIYCKTTVKNSIHSKRDALKMLKRYSILSVHQWLDGVSKSLYLMTSVFMTSICRRIWGGWDNLSIFSPSISDTETLLPKTCSGLKTRTNRKRLQNLPIMLRNLQITRRKTRHIARFLKHV